MRSFLFPVAVILSLGGASFAAAGTTSEGAITAVNRASHSITLTDGSTYVLPSSYDGKLNVGDQVSVVYSTNGKALAAVSVAVNSDASKTEGQVASINRASNSFTLTEGTRYSLDQDFNAPLKVGDAVSVVSARLGDSHEARIIARNSSTSIAQGSVTAVNLGSGSVTLSDGNTYALDQDFDQPLKVGDAVQVIYSTVGTSLEAQTISYIAG